MKHFESEQEALVWMEHCVLSEETNVTSIRVGYMDDKESMTRFKKIRSFGRGVPYENKVNIEGRLALIGCHYG